MIRRQADPLPRADDAWRPGTAGPAAPPAGAPADVPAGGAAEVMGDGGSVLGTAGSRARRALPLAIGAAVLAFVVLIGLLPGSAEDDAPLSPGNAAPDGARAVAEVLSAQGVDVVRPASYAEALALLDEQPSTVFLNDARGYLSAGQVQDLAGAAERIVLAAPGSRQLIALEEDFEVVGALPARFGDAEGIEADCADPSASAAVSVPAGGTAYSGPVECFPVDLEEASGGLWVTSTDGSVAILGAPALLSNRAIPEDGSAALALAALGSSPTLVWLEPTSADLIATGEGIDPTTLLPGWINVLLVWLLGCAVLAMFWRGRRLGPLAVEPLPVVVRAAETAEGRARLYQDSRAVSHAAMNLRAATLARIARRLRVSRSASAGEVLDAAARHSGLPRTDLEQRLLIHTPTTQRELVLWAQEILDLEK